MVRTRVAGSAGSPEGCADVGSGEKFHFISVQRPDSPKDRLAKRQARSHAVARGIRQKRKLQERSGHHFNVITSAGSSTAPSRNKRWGQSLIVASSPYSLSTDEPSLVEMLAGASPKLQALHMKHSSSHGATKPFFSVSDELVLKNFRSILRKGLNDNALTSAVMLTLAFAATAGNIDRECLGYQSEALKYIRRRMSYPEGATSESTLGAILLLAGIEVRTGNYQ
ncbi:hypothetical protein MMC25_002874 [Agyrium rufum]|nr:hypothetical protein [Agyrium rufum]